LGNWGHGTAVSALGMVVTLLAAGAWAGERRADVGVQLAFTDYSQFEDGDVGFGAGVSYRLTEWLAADGQVDYFPSDLGKGTAFSGSRLEGLFGVRLGHRFGGVQIYAAGRPGFVKFGEASEPFACILIFPQPLVCQLGGKTVFATDLGAGLELTPGERWVIRAEVGDLLVKYSGPALAKDGEVIDDHLWSHNLRLTASVGLRF
jgi:hypothetical protein